MARPPARRGGPSAAQLRKLLELRNSELDEALERQTATTEVLGVISSSPGELEPVFNTMLEKALRICGAQFGNFFLREGDAFRAVAVRGPATSYVDWYRQEPLLDLGEIQHTPLWRLAMSKKLLQVDDLRDDQGYLERNPREVALVESAGARSILGVPLLKENDLIGAFFIYRLEVRPFTDKHIGLLSNFAKQAVIAIENTRLLNELRESLQQQTATSEVLRIISSSPSELTPVFEAILANATRLCEAKFGTLVLNDADGIRIVATHDVPPAYAEFAQRIPALQVRPGTIRARLAETKQVVEIADLSAEPAYAERDPARVALVELAGARTLVAVPMLKDQELAGAIFIYRQEVRPFTEKQIELVKNFASQAVIAIENARLLGDLRHRTADLSESLRQQTATSEVLSVISSSRGELQPVFQAMLENASRLCEARFGTMYFREGDGFRVVAMYGASEAYVEARLDTLIHPGPHTGLGRAAQTKGVVQIDDIAADRAYSERDPMRVATVELGGVRALLCVPMLKGDELVGALGIYRDEVRPFTVKQIELVKNFADQAVIAIENARLFEEVQARNRDLTALGEVGRAVSSTLDLNVVLKSIVDRAVELSGADASLIFYFRPDTGRFELGETRGLDERAIDKFRRLDIGETETGLGEAITSRQPVQASDITKRTSNPLRNVALEVGMRAALIVPLLGAEGPLGALVLDEEKARAAGCDHYVTKPYSPIALLRMIRDYLGEKA